MKEVIKIKESQLKKLIHESVRKVLKEIENPIQDYSPFEDYSHELKESYSHKHKCMVKEYVGCTNNNLIVEGSFNRLYQQMSDKDFAIITAYRANFTKNQNIQRNRRLRGILNQCGMGVHQLVGHWQEAPQGKDWKDCDKSELTDVVERSYFVAKPDDMDFEDFKQFIMRCLTIGGVSQDCGIIHQNGDGYYTIDPNGKMDKIAEKLTLNKIAQAYSQYVKRLDLPFVFEGVESPSSIGGYRVFKKNNILY